MAGNDVRGGEFVGGVGFLFEDAVCLPLLNGWC